MSLDITFTKEINVTRCKLSCLFKILITLEHTNIRWNASLYFIITGYGIRDTELGAVVTAYEPNTPDDFISALRGSVTQIYKQFVIS